MNFTMMLDATEMKVRQLSDGYLVCRPRVARAGIQEYAGVEVGRPDLGKVRIWRPEEEVFAKDSVRSLPGKPVTIEHPSVPVTASNWKDYAVGAVGEDVLREGEFLRVPLMLMDSSAIAEVQSGKVELSVGYTAQLEWGDGETPDGEKYNAKQTSIRANHVAITDTARGGNKLRIGDKQEKTMRKVMVDGFAIEMDERDATHLERFLAALQKEADKVPALTTDVATVRTEVANATAVVATKDAEIATLKQQVTDAALTPQQLDKLVGDRVATVQRAKAIIGDSLLVDGKTDADMRRQVVNAKLGETAKNWTDEQIVASFNTLAVSPITDSSNNRNDIAHVNNVLLHNDNSGAGDALSKAYTDYDTALANRWKTAGVRNSA